MISVLTQKHLADTRAGSEIGLSRDGGPGGADLRENVQQHAFPQRSNRRRID
jgi:hypothetical protein